MEGIIKGWYISGIPSIRMAFHRSSSSPYNKIVSASGCVFIPPASVVAFVFTLCFSSGDIVTCDDEEDGDNDDVLMFIWIDPSNSN